MAAEIASRQHGTITRTQLLAAGWTSSAIGRALHDARLHRIHRGVYALGHRALSQEGRWMAAVLACGEGAVLSHWPAAHHHDLILHSPSLIDVTTPRATKAPRGVTRHRTRRLGDDEVTTKDGIPVTSVERTLADLADVAPESVVRRALNQAEILYGVTPSPINGRRGAKRLMGPPERSRSELERAFVKLCHSEGIVVGEQNARVYGLEVDVLWRDRERDQTLARHGMVVLRFTHRQITQGADEAARTVRAALASRPWR